VRRIFVLLVVMAIGTILIGGGIALTVAQDESVQPFTEIVNEQGTPCATASPEASPQTGQVATPMGLPAASPITVVLAGCETEAGTPTP
jgi:hypothetical protein